ncbi:MAG TPA: tRNA (N(6)-L-threonylcarbamoyladenosine(37)-C(2))-methylthiotransferase MtaB, partial [Sphingomicrobium sp.]|nr:tRNA (N(6)-L-threonylcarbamoyladenosine(37)-C(2))-methylthiotransferase MtaB [Sphingomicrobium sp.]
IFPFSARPDTPAARMPQLPAGTVRARAGRLREAASARRSRWLGSLVGTRQRVLLEGGGKGHSDGFAPVRIDGAERGEIVEAHITAGHGDMLLGRRA